MLETYSMAYYFIEYMSFLSSQYDKYTKKVYEKSILC